MKTIKLFAVILLAFVTIFSCNKSKEETPDYPDATLLLTTKPWKLLSYGFDHNKDGLISRNEESIKDCEKDNISVFNRDGSGIVMDNEISCEGNNKIGQFSWTLSNNDTLLDFTSGAAYITSLSGDNLIIRDTISDPVRLIVVYGH
jgi:hypothetical protein